MAVLCESGGLLFSIGYNERNIILVEFISFDKPYWNAILQYWKYYC